ncbi:hypothetical protein, partial [Agrobacterium vitis]
PRISSRPAAVRPIIREAGHMRAASRVQKDQKKGLTEGVSTYVSRGDAVEMLEFAEELHR